ncbi:hypothetical protein CONPUDRAFT_80270 [Coniophora puteana RWD-64-598 SS2]|uniref:Uncharacterized protein n=1 Tax=Coniophora puteana (strain RWD-64-598) TaxID=741705 RepID=A0A5M3MX63_CONPW|nr:uncharacterized protein CONPUDRAFT_80270 [Coniophora puteana RWD-64-598 SS2]EIW83587.1 hypothetical protein CONPUDRAFT_80270 [Coniophora puteana RWD-64-598 SS2]
MPVQTVSALDASESTSARAASRISQLKLQLGVTPDSAVDRPLRERTNSSKSKSNGASLLFKEGAKASRFKEPASIHLSPIVLTEPALVRKQSAPAPNPKSALSPDQIQSRRAYSVRTARERRYMRAERALACTLRHCSDAVLSSSENSQHSLELQRVRALEHALALLGTHAEIAKARIQELRVCLADQDVDPAERDSLLRERWAVEKRGREIEGQMRALADANRVSEGRSKPGSHVHTSDMRMNPKPNTPSSSPNKKGRPSALSSSSSSSASSLSSGSSLSTPAPIVGGPDVDPAGISSTNARGHEDPESRRAANLAAFFARSATHTPLHPRLPPGLGPHTSLDATASITSADTSIDADADTLTTQWDAYIHSTYTHTTHDPRTAFLPRRISLSDVSPIHLRPSSVSSPLRVDRARLLLRSGPGRVLNRPASFDTHSRHIQRLALSPSLSDIPDNSQTPMSTSVGAKVKGQASMPLLNVDLQVPGAPPRPERSPRRMSAAQASLAGSNNAASVSGSTLSSSLSSALTTPVHPTSALPSVPQPQYMGSGPVPVAAPTPSTMVLSGGATGGSAKIYYMSRQPRSAAELLSSTDLGEIRIPPYALSLLDSFDDVSSTISVPLGGSQSHPQFRARARTVGEEEAGHGEGKQSSQTIPRVRRSSASYVRVTAPRSSDVVDGYLAVNGIANGNGSHATFCIPNTSASSAPPSPGGGGAAHPGGSVRRVLSQVRLRPKRTNAGGNGDGNANANTNRHSLLVYMRKRMGGDEDESGSASDETATATAPPTPTPALSDAAVQAAQDKEKEEREREKRERMKESSFTRPLRRRFGAFWGSLW